MANRYLYVARHGEAENDGDLTDAGRRQARLLGERLRGLAFAAVRHSPLARAAQTASLVAAGLPGVPVEPDDLLGDYLPTAPDPAGLPAPYAAFLDGFTDAERADGPPLAAAALQRYARTSDEDVRELVITHNFQAAWFVRDALGAPADRWLGLNQANAALTVILYRPDRPPALVAFNDQSHLPDDLRWTGFPPALRG